MILPIFGNRPPLDLLACFVRLTFRVLSPFFTNGHFSDDLLMRIPNAANRFCLSDRCDLSQPVGFGNEITVHHGGAMLGQHEKLGVGFDYRQGRAAAAHRV